LKGELIFDHEIFGGSLVIAGKIMKINCQGKQNKNSNLKFKIQEQILKNQTHT
jgi:hypothetical protein